MPSLSQSPSGPRGSIGAGSGWASGAPAAGGEAGLPAGGGVPPVPAPSPLPPDPPPASFGGAIRGDALALVKVRPRRRASTRSRKRVGDGVPPLSARNGSSLTGTTRVIRVAVAVSALANTGSASSRWKTTVFFSLPGRKPRPVIVSVWPIATSSGRTFVTTGLVLAARAAGTRATPSTQASREAVRTRRDMLRPVIGGTAELLSASGQDSTGVSREPRPDLRSCRAVTVVSRRPRQEADLACERLGGREVDRLPDRHPQRRRHTRTGRLRRRPGPFGSGRGGEHLDVLEGEQRAAGAAVVALARDEHVDVAAGLDELRRARGYHVGHALAAPYRSARRRLAAGPGELVRRQVGTRGHRYRRPLAEEVVGRTRRRGGRVARGHAPNRQPLRGEPRAGGEVAARHDHGSVRPELAFDGGLAAGHVGRGEAAQEHRE